MKGVVVFVTFPRDSEKIQEFVNKMLEKRLCACVNVLEAHSSYWWKGKIEKDEEYLLIIKTIDQKIKDLEDYIITHHPYTTPEIVVFEPIYITRKYLEWLIEETSE